MIQAVGILNTGEEPTKKQHILAIRWMNDVCIIKADNSPQLVRTKTDKMISLVYSGTHKSDQTDPKVLSRKWGITLETANKVVYPTIRMCKRNTTDISLNQRYAVNDRMLRYPCLTCPLFTDTLLALQRCVSIRGYTCAQIFASEFGFIFPCLMKRRADMEYATKRLFKEIGVPTNLIMDRAKEQYKGNNRLLYEKSGCTIKEIEKGTPSAN